MGDEAETEVPVVEVWIVGTDEPPVKARQPKVSAPLPPFSGDSARCAKCGNTAASDQGIDVHYLRTPDLDAIAAKVAGHPLAALVFQQQQQPELPSYLEGLAGGQEVLLRFCGLCHYAWAEACLDDPTIGLAELS